MKLISWNVNGIRAVMGKGFLEFAHNQDADILCVQETKMQEGQADSTAEKLSSVLVFSGKEGIFRNSGVF